MRSKRSVHLTITLVATLLFSFGIKKSIQPSTQKELESLEHVYPLALRGEMISVLKILDTLNSSQLSDEDLKIKGKFVARFQVNNENYDYKTDDETIIKLVKLFQNYWKSVMLERETVEIADSLLKEEATELIYSNKTQNQWIKDSITNNLYRFSNQFLKDKGFYSNVFGKTSHMYDLFLWKIDDVKEYPIELIYDSVVVEVHFMKDFISQGWTHYATLGRNYASGWATKEALFAMEDAYKLNTENFKISYLTHEGQHFVDYKKYPKLEQADLEYRAKLVELVKSDSTTLSIIGKFIRNAANERLNAHAFANHFIISQLSQKVFNKNYITEKEMWQSVENTSIRNYAKELYDTHTKAINKIGAVNVQSYITNMK